MHRDATLKPDPIVFSLYKQLRNDISSKISKNKTDYLNKIVTTSKNSRSLWKAINLATGKATNNNSIPSELSASTMNEYFANIGKTLCDNHPDSQSIWHGPSSIYDFEFQVITSETVCEQLLTVPDTSKLDFLDFDSKLLRLAAPVISDTLSNLFHLSVSKAALPKDWKKARVTPIFKGKGKKSDCSSYRPATVKFCPIFAYRSGAVEFHQNFKSFRHTT